MFLVNCVHIASYDRNTIWRPQTWKGKKLYDRICTNRTRRYACILPIVRSYQRQGFIIYDPTCGIVPPAGTSIKFTRYLGSNEIDFIHN